MKKENKGGLNFKIITCPKCKNEKLFPKDCPACKGTGKLRLKKILKKREDFILEDRRNLN